MKYTGNDSKRIKPIEIDPAFSPEPYRTDYRRDYARVLHSPSFRRLQGKAQLFPGRESDFFRSRITHSLEVAQIAKDITIKLNYDLEQADENYRIDSDIVEFAGLAHDLGHPPFGHFGEEKLDEEMKDIGGFEGNAQTLRILAKTEKGYLVTDTTLGIDSHGKDKRVGLDLTVRSLASIIKYDREIPFSKAERNYEEGPIKGYYRSEKDVVDFIKQNICGDKDYPEVFKTIECQIMDIADDIAYSTYDLEDSFQGGFIKPIDLFCASDEVIEEVRKKVNDKLDTNLTAIQVQDRIRYVLLRSVIDKPLEPEFVEWPVSFTKEELDDFLDSIHVLELSYNHDRSKDIAENPYSRNRFSSRLVGAAIRKVKIKDINIEIPALTTIELEQDKKIDVEILKNIVMKTQILSPKIQIDAYRSKEIIGKIFKALTDDANNGYMFLRKDFRDIYRALKRIEDKKRLICDFIAGMTDRYALEFYGRLTSENPQTIFKPL